MRLIVGDTRDVYFHLSAEDYFLYHCDEELLMIWQSEKAVVCGKHQNLCAEANVGFCKLNNIQLARRLSGGGTVYHDDGNVNFTFIRNAEGGLDRAVNFKRFLDPVIAVLGNMGLKAEYSGRNDLLFEGKKISGNAEHIYQQKKRVLHHGTLLFDSRLNELGAALRSTGVYTDRAVKSVRSTVCNIKNELPQFGNTADFMNAFAKNLALLLNAREQALTEREVREIDAIKQAKYHTQAWIYGYSPKYRLKREFEYLGQKQCIELEVDKQIILELSLNGQVLNQYAGCMLYEHIEENILSELFGEPVPENLRYLLF
jgi:lipoate-protein ligase A